MGGWVAGAQPLPPRLLFPPLLPLPRRRCCWHRWSRCRLPLPQLQPNPGAPQWLLPSRCLIRFLLLLHK